MCNKNFYFLCDRECIITLSDHPQTSLNPGHLQPQMSDSRNWYTWRISFYITLKCHVVILTEHLPNQCCRKMGGLVGLSEVCICAKRPTPLTCRTYLRKNASGCLYISVCVCGGKKTVTHTRFRLHDGLK